MDPAANLTDLLRAWHAGDRAAREVSPRNVQSEWTFARPWLHRALEGDPLHVH